MAQENNHGQMNGQQVNAPKQAQGNKSIFKDAAFRKGYLAGAGTTLGGAALYFVGKVLIGKIKTAIAERKAKREAAPAEPTK